MKKRILSVLLAISMVMALIPTFGINVFAAGGLTRAEWITQLVAAFEMTVEDEGNMPDNYFSDITEDDSYYRDILLAVEFGVIDLEAGEAFEPSEPATREFAARSLNACLKYQLDEGTEYTFSENETVTYPDDIQVAINRGWFTLSGGNFLPEQAITSAEAEAMLTDAKTTIAGDTVEENYNSQYEFADGVIVVPETADVTIEGKYTVTIANWEGTINTDDIFVVYSYGIPVPLKAETVETGEEIVITATKEGAEDAIVSSDAQGSIELDLENFEFTEYTTYSVMDMSDPNAQPEEMTFELQSVDYDKKAKVLTASQKINLGSTAVGTISVKITNMVLDHKESFFEGEYKAAIRGDAVITTAISFDLGAYAGIPHSIPLGSTRILGLCDIALNMEYDIKGGVTATWTGELSAGASYSRTRGGFRMSSNFIKKSFDLNAHAEIQAGLKLSAKIDLPHFKVDAWATAGVRMYADITTHDSGTPKTCVTISGYLYVNVGASAYLNYLVDQESFFKQYDIYDEYNSPVRVKYHYEDDVLVPGCTRGLEVKYHTPTTSRYYNPYSNKSSYGGGTSSGGEVIEPVVIWEYDVDDGNAIITGYNGTALAVTVPSELDGYKVTGIGNKAFYDNQTIRSVTLPSGVKEIGNYAFKYCENLVSINLPSNLETLGSAVFESCTSLYKIYIPKSLDYCRSEYTYNYFHRGGPFSNSGIVTAEFEDGTTEIPDYIFANASNLKSVIVPETVIAIDSYAFQDCTALEEIRIPEYVTEIGKYAFHCCEKLKEIKLPSQIETLGFGVFSGCESLNYIYIPKSLQDCRHEATTSFYNNGGPFSDSGIVTAEFEDGDTEIPQYIFANATKLKKVIIPETVITIGNYAFQDCKALENVEIPQYIIKIGDYAFHNCQSLTEIFIPKSLESCGTNGPFCGSGIVTVKFEDEIKNIPSYLFKYCTKLKNIIIPQSVVAIGGEAFSYCSALEAIKIPENVKEIGYSVFAECTALKEMYIPDNVIDIGSGLFIGCTSLEKAKLPLGYDNIPYRTFTNCSKLVDVTFSDSIKSIHSQAFSKCEKLPEISIPETVTYIDSEAFYECSSLKDISIPENVNNIGNNAFENCDGLQKVTVNGSGNIGQKAFYDCDALTDLTISDAVTSIGSNMCYSCDKLTNVKLGRGITTIPDSAFRQCASLTEVTLPRFCTTVAANAFAEDVKLTTVNVPVSVSKIETNSFSYPAKMTFNGKTGSYAEEYASSRNIKFNAVDAPITNIKYADSKMSIGTDTTVFPALTIEPEFDTDTVTFSSSDENILTVSDAGRVTSGWRNYGTAKITATTGSGKSTSIDITVVKTADSIGLDNTSLNLDLGTIGKLTATMSPSDAVDVLEWSSSNSDIAEVDQNGNVTAKAKGTAVITVKASYSGVSATCTVTVIPPAEITAFTVDKGENGYTANITTADVPIGVAVWVAAYDENNALVGIQKVAANKAAQAEFDTPDAANFKAFVWNMTTLKPLTSSREAPVITGV